MTEKSMNITDYLKGTTICREERQYALFLYNEIVSRNEEILDLVLNKFAPESVAKIAISKVTINDVFFEFAFMRDTFSAMNLSEKEAFNLKLLMFSTKKLKEGNLLPPSIKSSSPETIGESVFKALKDKGVISWNLGAIRNYKDYEDNAATIYYARCMMNAKPDIAILFSYEGKQYMRFVECKLEYSESKYDFGFRQTDIQNSILEYIMKNTVQETIQDKKLSGVSLLNFKNKIGKKLIRDYLLSKHEEYLK